MPDQVFESQATESWTAGPEKIILRLAALAVVSGPEKGKQISLETGTVTIGTHPQCDLMLTDRRVSSRHVEVALRANGYLLKDLGSRNGTRLGGWRVERLYLTPGMQITIGSTTLAVVDLKQEQETRLSASNNFGEAVGRALETRALFARLETVSRSDSNLLFEGETGTGKTFLAEQVHRNGPRADGPFEVFDCGVANPALIESQLFGHVKGAFTGADRERPGAIERANGGTLFLDEIGDLPLPLQPKLLRVIESRTFQRLGETRSRRADVRIMAATNVKLDREVARKRFRQDLFYRLAVIRIRVPPLRDRLEDLPQLIDTLSQPLLAEGQDLEGNITSLMPLLGNYDWPGNVRELRNVVQRLIDLPPLDALPTAIRPAEGQRQAGVLAYKSARNHALEQFERRYVVELLQLTRGNVSRAAELADVSRRHITALMSKHGIAREGR